MSILDTNIVELADKAVADTQYDSIKDYLRFISSHESWKVAFKARDLVRDHRFKKERVTIPAFAVAESLYFIDDIPYAYYDVVYEDGVYCIKPRDIKYPILFLIYSKVTLEQGRLPSYMHFAKGTKVVFQYVSHLHGEKLTVKPDDRYYEIDRSSYINSGGSYIMEFRE